MTALGTLGGDLNAGRAGGAGFGGLNDPGVAVGASYRYDPNGLLEPQAALFRDGVAVDLGAGDGSQATAVNNRGDVIGYGQSGSGAFLYRHGILQEIPTLGGPNPTTAEGINERGDVVGGASVSDSEYHAFVYSHGEMHDLGTPGYGSQAIDINNRGDVVGYSWLLPGGAAMTYLYSHGVMSSLPDFEPRALNDNGVIVGQTHYGYGNPAVYKDGVVNDLGPLPGWDSGWAADINDAGTIVGSFHRRYLGTAFLYEKGHMYLLDDLVPDRGPWTFRDAFAINNRGQIVVEASNSETNYLCGFILTPSNQ